MRIMMKVGIPVESGNKAVRDGTLQQTVGQFVETFKPEAVYFSAEGGKRTAYFVLDVENSVDLPAIAEPFFFALNAEIHTSICMNLEDMRAGVGKAVKTR